MPDRISLVAVGATGQGKSTLGNTLSIAESSPFEISDSFDSQTRRCSHADFDDGDVKYRFVDTVGFFDTKMTPDLVYSKFAEFSDRVPGGVDIFLYIEQKGRFNEEQLKRFNVFKEYVGSEALRHTILVFTRIQNRDLSRQLKLDADDGRIPKALKEVLDQVHGVVGVESLTAPGIARCDILNAAQTLLQQLSGCTYANQALQDALERRRKLQDIVERLEAGERRRAMEHALQGLYDGSRAFADVRGNVLHAEVSQQKERAEERLRAAEAQAVELRALHAQHRRESQRAQEELRAAREGHGREKEEWKHAGEERSRQLEADKRRWDGEHANELAKVRAEAEAQSLALELKAQRDGEESRRITKELELSRLDLERRMQEQQQRAESDRSTLLQEHQEQVGKHEEDLHKCQSQFALEVKQRDDEMDRMKQQHHDTRDTLQRQQTAHQKHDEELEEQQLVISSQRSTIHWQQQRIETLQLQRLAAAASLTACFFATAYAARRK